MKFRLFISILIIICLLSCTESSSQKPNEPDKNERKVGGNCEGCEAIYESEIHFEKLNWTDTLPGYSNSSQKLIISGRVFKKDGKTPAPGVVLYIYHTDEKGVYPTKRNEKGWAKRHGYLRGWIKTNENGEYKFFTFKPASYPNSNNPAHIHIIVKEPEISAYWIDDYLFATDPFLSGEEKKRESRGSNGLLTLQLKNGVLHGERNIYLGKGITGY